MRGKIWYARRDDILSRRGLELFMTLRSIDISVSEVEHEYLPVVSWRDINDMLKENLNVFICTDRKIDLGQRVLYIGDMEKWPDWTRGNEKSL